MSLKFNSLDYQREAGESFIASQKAEGWTCLPDRYDDAGYSGGTIDRPALRKLLEDIKAGRIDCVVVYKIDRMSRSLLDFTRMMEVFEEHAVAFVSVTQQFNTATSMGRLMVNVLLSFAQYEREIIGERTRDKIAAARRKGYWTGGKPLLGYDIDRSVRGSRLVVNEPEAERARVIFRLYLEQGSLLKTIRVLNERGWTTKRWKTKAGKSQGGRPFTKTLLSALLTNPLYVGKVRYLDEIHDGDHEAIVPDDLWQRVQDRLQANLGTGGRTPKHQHTVLLKGLLRCEACDSAMGHTYPTENKKRYCSYRCRAQENKGNDKCPCGLVPAGEIEQFIVDEIARIGRDPALVGRAVSECDQQHGERLDELRAQRKQLRRKMGTSKQRMGRTEEAAARSVIQDEITDLESRVARIDAEIDQLESAPIEREALATTLSAFETVWAALEPGEQRELMTRLIDHIDYDAAAETVRIAFRSDIPDGWFEVADVDDLEDVA